MTFTIRRSILVVVVSLLVVAAGIVLVSQRASAASATPVVYVATGENFPDALGASAAAAVQAGPVLLVQKDSIPAVTAAELSRLAPDVIYVSGGTAVVSDAVFNQLKTYAPSVVRVAGANRYSTAVEVSKSAFPASGGASTAALEARIAHLEALLAGVTRSSDTLRFSGMNVQIDNGGDYASTTRNGLGNLVIGPNYNVRDATGSHYLVMGERNSYTGYGGIVATNSGDATGDWTYIIGGHENSVSGNGSVVIGGQANSATFGWSTTVGGYANNAQTRYATAVGGQNNTAAAEGATVSGGMGNVANGENSSVSGGRANYATGDYSSVSGGSNNAAMGDHSSILGAQSLQLWLGHETYPVGP
jgi:hypothetical protein